MSAPTVARSARVAAWAAALLAIAASLLAAWAWHLGQPLPDDEFRRLSIARYEALWTELEAAAEAGAREVAEVGSAPEDLRAFAALATARRPEGRASLFLVDRFGGLAAWAGDGLAHPPTALRGAGRGFKAGFSSISLTVTRPLASDDEGRAIVAGASLPADRLPFDLPREADRDVLWTLVEPQAPRETAALAVEAPGAPVLLVRRPPAGPSRPEPRRLALAWLLVAAAAAAAWVRVGPRPALRAAAAAAALGCAARAAGAGGMPVAAVVLGLGLAIAAWRVPPRTDGGLPATLRGAFAALVVLGLAFTLQGARGAVDFGAAFLAGEPNAMTLRFALFLAAFAVWALAAGSPRRPLAARAAVLALAAAASVAVAGEAAYRVAARRELDSLLSAMAPPTGERLAAAADELRGFFAALDPADLTPGDPRRLTSSDLAYVLWRRAPMRHERALSALRVEPLAAEASEFTLGLTLADGELVESTPLGGSPIRGPVWDFTLVADEAEVYWRGEPWARVRYWLLPQPGYGLPGGGGESLSRRLLRGGPGLPRTAERALDPARYVLYARDGTALISPWRAAPRLTESLRATGGGTLQTPDGPAWAVAAEEADGTRVLLLPRLSAIAALERVGTAFTGILLLASLLGGLAIALRSGDTAFRAALVHPLRSYSIRLVVVFSLLLALPALALNFLILTAMARRLEAEQRSAGEVALGAAERVLSDYAAAQAPGVGIDSVLDDELLTWLSEVLRTEVNLYFGGTVYATSKRELYTAGLLPERVPGEIYARLSLQGEPHVSRSRQTGDVRYRELYAPLLVPGAPSSPTSLFVSVPLVAQQEAAAEQLAGIRRQVVVATGGLVLLLAVLGARLARGFTAPLTAILDGTRRIAAGAPSLGLAPPAAVELSTLVEAIDRMAARIAEGRQQLLREKRVIEQMVEHSTAAVVSLDEDQCVLLQNGLAADLLGTVVGESLSERLATTPRLAPVRSFATGDPSRLRRDTVKLMSEAGEDPREWSLVWVPIPGEGEPSALFVVEDVSDVLRGQRLAAWAEMARIIAHEIKNPLTPIRLSAEHMREVRERDAPHFDEVFDRCTRNILVHVDELQRIASEFSTYSRIPRIELREGDLARFVEQVVAGYRAAPPPGVAIEYAAELDEIRARFDARLLGRALRNLLENALRATADGGRVAVRARRRGDEVEVEVEDDGPGVNPADLDRIFEPYFSTHDSGTGLGLPIARRVVEGHGGRISARNRIAGGLRVTMSWPAA